ncbi:MAG: cyclic nucleotide-binding domain-containing protein [Anaerolineae bacterium]
MEINILTTLSLTDIFDNLTDTQLKLVAAICEPDVYKKGAVLLRENDDTDEFYVIARGSVEILMDPMVVGTAVDEKIDPIVLTQLRQGQVFGEVALVDQGMRTATARVSRDDTQLLRIPRQRIMLLCETYPELGYKLMKNLAADLAFKIRNTDLTVRQYQLMLSQAMEK